MGLQGRLSKSKKMNNKFASLGTALSRDEAKKVMGGKIIGLVNDEGGGSVCATCGTQSICGSDTKCVHSTTSCCIECNGVKECIK
jgi:hypothetical protein